jgi:hypothetical protein
LLRGANFDPKLGDLSLASPDFPKDGFCYAWHFATKIATK